MSEPLKPAPAENALNYATPSPTTRRITPATLLVFGGLGLIFLGGCFLIGVFVNTQRSGFGPPGPPVPMLPSEIFLLVILYAAAFGCFGGAIYFFRLAIRWLR